MNIDQWYEKRHALRVQVDLHTQAFITTPDDRHYEWLIEAMQAYKRHCETTPED